MIPPDSLLFSILCYAILFFTLVFTWCMGRRVGRRESQNCCEPLANQSNLSGNSTEIVENLTNRITDQDQILQLLLKKISSLVKSMEAMREAKENHLKQLKSMIRRVEIRMSRIWKDAKNQSKAMISSLQADIAIKDDEITELKKMRDSIFQNNEFLAKSINTMAAANENHHITETTIRARIPKISQLTDVLVYSQPAHFAAIDWRTSVYKKDDHLALFLDGEKFTAAEWSCSAFVELQLISQKNEEVVLAKKFTKAEVYRGTMSWGFGEFISFEDLYDEEKGYVEDDSIIIAAVIKVFPSQ